MEILLHTRITVLLIVGSTFLVDPCNLVAVLLFEFEYCIWKRCIMKSMCISLTEFKFKRFNSSYLLKSILDQSGFDIQVTYSLAKNIVSALFCTVVLFI